MPNFIEIEETFCGRTDGRTFETHFIRSTQKSRPKKKLTQAENIAHRAGRPRWLKNYSQCI